MNRADSDLAHFKKENINNICIVVAWENAIAETSEKYFLDKGNIDKIFYLCDGKRSSGKAIWKKQHFKNINKTKLMELINFVEEKMININA